MGVGAKDRDQKDENPFDQVAALKRVGFGTLRLPEHLGGAGFTVPQLFSAVIDIARADPIVAHIFRTHFWFVEERLRTASDPASQRWLSKVAEGRSSATRSAKRDRWPSAAWCSTRGCCQPEAIG
jgi:alkylation response protein AidB-like acyl-CoA dehydrogenase